MDQTLGLWVAPLLLIPGMALLILSTSAKYTQLLLHVACHPDQAYLRRQLPILRKALIALYTGVAVDAVAAVLGHLLVSSQAVPGKLVPILSCLGVACLVFAAICLIINMSHDSQKELV